MKNWLGVALGLLLGLLLAMPAAVRAQSLPPDMTAMLTLKVLTFDRNLAARAGGGIVIGVVFKAGESAAAEALRKSFAAYADKRVNGLAVTVQVHQFVDATELGTWMGSAHVTAVVVSDGLNDQAGAIHKAAAEHRCLTIGSGAFVNGGGGLGFALEAGKPRIIIHRLRSKEEGVDFSADLLQIAKVL